MDKYNFMHCIRPFCIAKLNPPWDNYVINWSEIREDSKVLKKYKCPYCGITWNVMDCAFVDVKVNGYDPKENFIIVDCFGKEEWKVIGIFYPDNLIQIIDDFFIHIPSKFLTSTSRMFSVPDNVKEDEDILNYLKNVLEVKDD